MPQRKSEQNRKFDNDDKFLSPARIKELQDEIVKLEKHVRPKVVIDLTAAREMGDLSENAAYSYAKGKLMGIDRRLHEIKEKIKHAVVIRGGADEDGAVCVGCTVTVSVNGKEKSFEIMGSQETDPGSGRISHTSPVGSALMGRKAGESATIKIDDREITYDIIDVE